LINAVQHRQAIDAVDPRQYGVVVFLVFDPAIRFLGLDGDVLAGYALAVALPCVLAAFGLVARRYAADDLRRLLMLAILWLSSVPLLYVIAQRMVDAWQLFFLSAALFLFTGSPRLRRFAGVPLGAA